MSCGEVCCLADNATTHTLLRDRKYFSNLILIHTSMETISGPTNLIEGRGRAQIILSNGTKFTIVEALYSPRSSRTLLSFKDI
jgi:hypothetical protein